MSTRKFVMPKVSEIGTAGQNGRVRLDAGFQQYLGGIEDATGRVAANLDPSTATAAQIVSALITAGLMKAE